MQKKIWNQKDYLHLLHITRNQETVLRYFLEGLDQYKGKLRLNNIIEARWPDASSGQIPLHLRENPEFMKDYRDMSDGFRMNIGQGLIERTGLHSQYQLSSRGEDYILEVLWKDE